MDQYRVSLNALKYTNLKEKSEIKFLGDIVVFDNGDLFSQSIIFENKTFNCGKLIFENFTDADFTIKLNDCIFDCEIEFEKLINSKLEIIFINCLFKKDFNFNQNKIKTLKLVWYIDNKNSYLTNIKISISSNEFEMFCNIKGLNQLNGDLTFIGNVFLKQPREIHLNSKTNYTICEISNSKISNGCFNNNKFYLPFDFTNNSLYYDDHYKGHTFKNNLFQKANFSKTDFGKIGDFFNCDFFGTTLFDEIKNIENTKLHFRRCKFLGFTHFDSSEINSLIFEYILFERNVSFKNSNFGFFLKKKILIL